MADILPASKHSGTAGEPIEQQINQKAALNYLRGNHDTFI